MCTSLGNHVERCTPCHPCCNSEQKRMVQSHPDTSLGHHPSPLVCFHLCDIHHQRSNRLSSPVVLDSALALAPALVKAAYSVHLSRTATCLENPGPCSSLHLWSTCLEEPSLHRPRSSFYLSAATGLPHQQHVGKPSMSLGAACSFCLRLDKPRG